jgi:hypothetical protein
MWLGGEAMPIRMAGGAAESLFRALLLDAPHRLGPVVGGPGGCTAEDAAGEEVIELYCPGPWRRPGGTSTAIPTVNRILYGAFVPARRALNGPFRRFPGARAVGEGGDPTGGVASQTQLYANSLVDHTQLRPTFSVGGAELAMQQTPADLRHAGATRRGCLRRSHTALYMLYGESRMEYTGCGVKMTLTSAHTARRDGMCGVERRGGAGRCDGEMEPRGHAASGSAADTGAGRRLGAARGGAGLAGWGRWFAGCGDRAGG